MKNPAVEIYGAVLSVIGIRPPIGFALNENLTHKEMAANLRRQAGMLIAASEEILTLSRLEDGPDQAASSVLVE